MSHSVIPAIIPKSLAHLAESISIAKAFAGEVQIDLVDGEFVPYISWPYGEGEAKGDSKELLNLPTLDVEVHFMVKNQNEDLISSWCLPNVRRVVVQIEEVKDLGALKRIAHAHNVQFGVCALNDTPLTTVLEAMAHADYVQCMGISAIGAQGLPFDERVIERIKKIRTSSLGIDIAVDGSVNQSTKDRLLSAGATRLIVGSGIFAAAVPQDAYNELAR